MSDTVISVENLSKRYVLSHQNSNGEGLRHRIEDFARAPFRWLNSAFTKKAPDLYRAHSGGSAGATEDFWALKDVSFEIKRGDVVGIIGRNGAGKSTLLKILSRIVEPTAGRVVIDGRVASLLEVGTGFHPELTGRENIFLNGAILGMSRLEIRKKFDEIVAFAEVEKFLDTPVKRYSSGMYVRLAFAVAAHLESEVLLVDEVLAVGDAEFQRKCLGRMSAVASEGRTILFVSHNSGAVATLCTQALLMENGRCRQQGPVRDVLHAYHASAPRDAVELKGDGSRPGITRVSVNRQALAGGGFDLEVEFASPFPLNPPILGVVVSDLMGVPIFGTNTLMHPDHFAGRAARMGTARLQVVDLPLHPGEYRATVFLAEPGRQHDCQRDVITFDFMPRKPVVNCPPVESIGPLNVQASWRLND